MSLIAVLAFVLLLIVVLNTAVALALVVDYTAARAHDRDRDDVCDLGPGFSFDGSWKRTSRRVDAPQAGPKDTHANVYALYPDPPARLDDHRDGAA